MNIAHWPRQVAFALTIHGFVSALSSPSVADEPIPIEQPAADREVDFTADILPFLQHNCLACHNTSTAEGEVVLETPELLRAARDGGPLVVAGDVEASRLLRVAAHRDEPIMPPADNKVGAVALKPAELGLLELWIKQGAKNSQNVPSKVALHWQPLPDSYQPILATAVAPAGDMAVCARGNDLMVYGLQPAVESGQILANLVDPALNPTQVGPLGAAHLDLVRAVAIGRESEWIASAGFRSVKLWQRYQPSHAVGVAVPNATASAATPDGKQWAVGGADGSIQLINASGDKSIPSWKGHDQPVIGLAFVQNGQVLVSAAKDGSVRAWQTTTGAALAGWRLSNAPQRMIMAADDLLVTAADDPVLRVWPLAIPTEPPKDGAPAELPALAPARVIAGHGRQIAALAVLPGHARQFLSASVDGTVRQWNADDGNQVKVWIHGDAVSAIGVQADGGRFVSVGADRAAKVWNVTATDPVATLQGDYRQTRRAEHLGRLVEVAQANVKDSQDAVQTAEKQLVTDQEFKTKALAALEEAKKLLAEKTTALNDVKAKQEAGAKGLAELGQKRDQAEQALADANTRNANSEKEVELLAAAVKLIAGPEELATATAALEKVRQDRQAYLQILQRDAQAALDARTKERDAAQAAQEALAKQVEEAQKVFTTATAANKEAENGVSRGEESIARSTKAIETAKQVNEACAAKLAAQEKLRTEASQRAQVEKPLFALASFSSDSKRLLLADDRGRMFVFDAQTFAPAGAWEGEASAQVGGAVAGMFVDDKQVLLFARDAEGNGKLTSWALSPAWKLARTIGSPDDAETLVDRVLSLDFSPDGTLLATGSGDPSRSGQIAVWNVADGSLVRKIDQPHSDTVFGLAFSPDGEYLASASADRTMKVFRAATGEHVHTFEGHTDHVIGVSWRANGKQLATCGADQKIKIWDFVLGEQRRTIDAGGKEITGVSFLSTGGKLVSSSGDRNVRIHNADDGAVVRTISGAAGYLFCCAATETGNMILAGGADRVLRVWNGEDGAELLKIESK